MFGTPLATMRSGHSVTQCVLGGKRVAATTLYRVDPNLKVPLAVLRLADEVIQ